MFAYCLYMQAHTKSTFFVLAFIGLGVLVWWWLPQSTDPTQSADRTSREPSVTDDTTVTDPVPTEPAPGEPTIPTSAEPQPASGAEAPAPEIQVTDNNTGVVQAEIVVAFATDEQTNAACAPVSFGEIAWGDGTNETVYGLGCGANQQTLDISHEYSTPGEYTITFMDRQQLKATQTVTVDMGANDGTQPTIEVDQSGRTVTIVVRGVEDETGPVTVDGPITFGYLAWGDGTTDRVSGLSGRPSNPVTHEYAATGTFTLRFELTSGDVVERSVTIN